MKRVVITGLGINGIALLSEILRWSLSGVSRRIYGEPTAYSV